MLVYILVYSNYTVYMIILYSISYMLDIYDNIVVGLRLLISELLQYVQCVPVYHVYRVC